MKKRVENIDAPKRPVYEGLVISSGGFKGFGILGSMYIYDRYGYLDCKKFAGCSVGSAILLLYAVGWKPLEMYYNTANIKLFNSIHDFSLQGFQENKGLVDNSHIREELENLVIQKRVSKKIKLPTLLDLHQEGIYIAFSVTDRISRKNVKLDYKSHPHLKATEGALMSSNIPFLYEPIEYDNMLLADGALSNPFPVDFIDDGNTKILGISVFGIKDSASETILEHATNTIMISVEQLQRLSAEHASDKVDIMEMKVADINYFDGGDQYRSKNKMFLRGVDDALIMHKLFDKKAKILALRKNNLRAGVKNTKPYPKRKMPHVFPEPIHELEIPERVIMSCLMSQPMEVLCQVAKFDPKGLLKLLPRLPKEKLLTFLQLVQVISRVNKSLQKIYEKSPEVPATEVTTTEVTTTSPKRKPTVTREYIIETVTVQTDKPVVVEADDDLDDVLTRLIRRETRNDYSSQNRNPRSQRPYSSVGNILHEAFSNLPSETQAPIAGFVQSLNPQRMSTMLQGFSNMLNGVLMITGAFSSSNRYSAYMYSSSDRYRMTSQNSSSSDEGPRIELLDD